MIFRTGKYDAHEGQKKPMHQLTVRITDVQDLFIPRLFGEAQRVTLVRDGTNSAILRKTLPGEHGTKIGNTAGYWGVSFHETHNEWLSLVSPAWSLVDCEFAVDYDKPHIKFTFPPVSHRQIPRKMHRGAAPESALAAPGAVGDVLMVIGDKSFTSKGVPLAVLEGIKSFVGKDAWE